MNKFIVYRLYCEVNIQKTKLKTFGTLEAAQKYFDSLPKNKKVIFGIYDVYQMKWLKFKFLEDAEMIERAKQGKFVNG